MWPPLLKVITKKRSATYYAPAFLLIFFITAFYTIRQPSLRRRSYSATADRFLLSSSNDTIAGYLRSLTLRPHLAGTESSLVASDYVFSHFSALGLPTRYHSYFPLLSYPTGFTISLHFSNGSSVDITASENNDKLLVPPYHAYSPSGEVNSEIVFANFGRQIDYDELEALGANVSGRVVLIRRGGGMRRACAVEAAEKNGAAAVLMFTEWDRQGRTTEEFRGGKERGTVMRRGIGDPLSPGWAAVDGAEKLADGDATVVGRFPKIPSLPISYHDADVILQTLTGPRTPSPWGFRDLRVGPGPTVVNLKYKEEKKVSEIRNVVSVLEGYYEPDRFVLLGNHRDAWTYGAVDPNSGTAALLDVARRFSELMATGWRPRRSIVFCSWDAEEFGMIGSTEWVEQNEISLGGKAVAYLNVDCAVQGAGIYAGATPQLDNLIREILMMADDLAKEDAAACMYTEVPKQNLTIHRLGGVDSDFSPFLHHAGVPSLDLYYGKDFPVYHTAYDSYEWMIKNADPCFLRHVSMTNIWGLLALRLADDSVLPFDYLSYATELQKYREQLSALLDKSISLHPLDTAIEKLTLASEKARVEAEHLKEVEAGGGFTGLKLRDINDRLMLAERGFLDGDGVGERRWFKHLIYGLSGEFDGGMDAFPGIMGAVDGRTGAVQHEVWRVARAVERAAAALCGGFS